MNETEFQLTQMLRAAAPEPPAEMSLATLVAARDSQLRTAVADAPRRLALRRFMPLIAAGAVAACVAGVVGGLALANDGKGHQVSPGSATPTPSLSSPVNTAGAPCIAGQLSASVLRTDHAMSHQLSVIGLRNSSSTSCSLTGYGVVSAYGSAGLISATIAHGTYLISDPGPRTVVLAAGAIASIGVETSTGYSGPSHTLTSLKIYPSGAKDPVTVSVAMSATSASGSPIVLNISAFGPEPAASPSSTTSPSNPTTPTTPTNTSTSKSSTPPAVAACNANELSVAAGRVDSGAGQRYLPITITNASGPKCTVTGYPQGLIANSSIAGDRKSQLTTTTSHGTGTPTTITLAPKASASFVLHTTIGYDGAQVTIKLLRFQTAGSSGEVTVAIPDGGLAANGPSGQPIPLQVTAFKAGSEG